MLLKKLKINFTGEKYTRFKKEFHHYFGKKDTVYCTDRCYGYKVYGNNCPVKYVKSLCSVYVCREFDTINYYYLLTGIKER